MLKYKNIKMIVSYLHFYRVAFRRYIKRCIKHTKV